MATEVSFARTFLAILDKHPRKITADHVEDPRNYPASTPVTLPRLSSSKPMSKPGARRSHHRSSSPSSSPPTATSTGPSEPSLTVTVSSPRNPPLSLTLPTPLPIATTSMLDIKTAVSATTGIPVDKLKLLHSKKPVADTKTLKDVVLGHDDGAAGKMELGLMVMGGAATARKAEEDLQAAAARRAAAAAEEAVIQVQGKTGGKKDVDVDMEAEEAPTAVVVAEGSGPSGLAVVETEEFWADLKGFLQQRVRDEKAAEQLCGKFRGAV